MIAVRIAPRARDLGDGFTVRRMLPTARARSVGPFVFFDRMGPVAIAPGGGLDVRPHPHIGLATVTYLFEGEILHRDSLGVVQRIRPGEVNWMTAGRGIVHSERTPPELRAGGSRLSGIQVWVALPREREEDEPSFAHHADLPSASALGAAIRVVLGHAFGATSPVATASPTFYVDVALEAGAALAIPGDHPERAIFVVDGSVALGDETVGAGEMLVLAAGASATVRAAAAARVVLFGGAPLDGPRFVWWNLVSSRRERIAQAAADWKAGRFASVPGEHEFIPLPDDAPAAADDR